MAADQSPHPKTQLLPAAGHLWRTADLTAQGVGHRTIASLVAAGVLVRLRYGCYVRGSEWEQQPPRWRNLQMIHAHALATRTTSAGGFRYSHTSGARLHRLHLWNVDTKVHLTQAVRPSKDRHGRDVICHTGKLAAAEKTLVDGLRTTSLERTVVDCCLILAYRQSLVLMDHALRLGADRGMMDAMAAGLAGRRGIKNLKRVLTAADSRSESPGETLTRDLLVRLKLPMPDPQVEVRTSTGLYRLDFAWRRRKVALEFDGRTKYFDYQPTDEVLFKERQRENALIEAGWTFIRVTWKDLFDEAAFKERILSALGL